MFKHNNISKCFLRYALIVLMLPAAAFAEIHSDPNQTDRVLIGNVDGSHIRASLGDTVMLPIWIWNDENAGGFCVPLKMPSAYIGTIIGCNTYGTIHQWDILYFNDPLPDEPSPGFTTMCLWGQYCSLVIPYDQWVPLNTNGAWEKIADIIIVIAGNPALLGTTASIVQGFYPPFADLYFNSTNGDWTWFPMFTPGYIDLGYAYLPGDANMGNGAWPPAVTGSDLTYLVNFFKSYPCCPGCLLNGFWAAGDINGDCVILGSDVTRLQNYFRGTATISYCPGYPPLWPTTSALPPTRPVNWPNCGSTLLRANLIPSSKAN